MKTVTRVIATTHEVSLKGGNRKWFERQLNANVRQALADLPLSDLQRPNWRLLLSFSEPVPFAEVARRLGTVFGLNSYMPVEHAGHTVEEVVKLIDSHLGQLSTESFAVRCLRSDKRYPLTSIEIERQVGEVVQQRTGWKVDLSSPELTLQLLVDGNGIWFWVGTVKGPGGLPVGTGGRAACLLSGGIDSPVAAYMLMKRGMRLDFVHFHSVPRTDMASLEKVQDIVAVLNRYQGSCRIAMVPLLPIQEKIVADCPVELRVLLYRRFMLRLAGRLSYRLKAKALVTGESLGQVASQTLENLGAVEAIATLPVLRPLVGLDKLEIIALARRAGTYEISIQPHFDCCSFLVPERPATRATARDLKIAEEALAVEELVSQALDTTKLTRVEEASSWEEIPIPAGVQG
jgi:thiamine biosynthesis protein ThiI